MPEITIPLKSHDEAMLVLGPYDRFAKLMRQALDIELYARKGNLRLEGGQAEIEDAYASSTFWASRARGATST